MLPAFADPAVIHDARILTAIEKAVGRFTGDEALPTADEPAKSLEGLPEQPEGNFELPMAGTHDPADAALVREKAGGLPSLRVRQPAKVGHSDDSVRSQNQISS